MASVSKVHTKDGRTKYRARYHRDRTPRERWFDRKIEADAFCAAVVTDQMAHLPTRAVKAFRMKGDM